MRETSDVELPPLVFDFPQVPLIDHPLNDVPSAPCSCQQFPYRLFPHGVHSSYREEILHRIPGGSESVSFIFRKVLNPGYAVAAELVNPVQLLLIRSMNSSFGGWACRYRKIGCVGLQFAEELRNFQNNTVTDINAIY